MTIDDQVNIACAVRRYLNAKGDYDHALTAEREARERMREIAAERQAFVVKTDYKHWLVRHNENAAVGFTIEPIDVI